MLSFSYVHYSLGKGPSWSPVMHSFYLVRSFGLASLSWVLLVWVPSGRFVLIIPREAGQVLLRVCARAREHAHTRLRVCVTALLGRLGRGGGRGGGQHNS